MGGVCTHSKFLRQGIATKLLKRAMKTLAKANCDIAFLCTNIKKLGPLYSKVGFIPLDRKYRATGESGKIYIDEGGMIAAVNSKSIFKEVQEDKKVFDMQGQDW